MAKQVDERLVDSVSKALSCALTDALTNRNMDGLPPATRRLAEHLLAKPVEDREVTIRLLREAAREWVRGAC